ncbi:hypothetical protein [Tsukamurella sp. 1534]|uniref:hypothetical protein n=1 Tax=Tsukamurella sp. 1534 TaxID=1151061 RepID=UPI0003161D94|nr:hypothetical protein [Tsukamurella sp. 1534]
MPTVTLVTATMRFTCEPSGPAWPMVDIADVGPGGATEMYPGTVVVTATVAEDGDVAATTMITGRPHGAHPGVEVTRWFTDGDDLPPFATEFAEHAKKSVVRATEAVAA